MRETLDPDFRKILSGEFESAYSIVYESALWLENNEFPCYLVPEERYYERTVAGENFGLYVNSTLCAVVSLTHDFPAAWETYISHKDILWLGSLASLRNDEHKGYGKLLVHKIHQYASLTQIAAIYLDCYFGDGRLPAYYENLGYEALHRMDLIFEDNTRHDSVLMRHIIPSHDRHAISP